MGLLEIKRVAPRRRIRQLLCRHEWTWWKNDYARHGVRLFPAEWDYCFKCGSSKYTCDLDGSIFPEPFHKQYAAPLNRSGRN